MTEYDEEPDYRYVEKAIRYLSENFREQPTLGEVAEHLGMSPFHLQRLFKRWAGVSPKRFLQYLTLEHAKELLRDSHNVLETSYESGLSSASRLHDLFVTVEGVTPGEYREGGAGVTLRWGVHPTPFGDALFAATDRGLTSLTFVPQGRPSEALDSLQTEWPDSALVEDPAATRSAARAIFGTGKGAVTTDPGGILEARPGSSPPHLRLHLRGTNFQIRVWEALLRIPVGRAVSYGDLAEAVDRRGAARAVGSAVGRNPVAVIIPCHRVLRREGGVGGYRWGTERKRALLAWEGARRAETTRSG